MAEDVNGDGDQDDAPLDRPFPVRAHAKKRERGADRREQNDTEHRAGDAAGSAGNRRASDHDGGNHFHLQAEAGVARNLIEADGVQYGGQARERSENRERQPLHRERVETRETRGARVRARRVDGAAGREMP